MSYSDYKAPETDTPYDRDRRIEEKYTFPRGADESVLGFISQNQEALADEFMEWRRHHRDGERALQAMIRWEDHRFGAVLFTSAHELLWFRIRRLLNPAGPRPAPAEAPKRPAVTDEAERLRRFDEAAGRLARQKALV